MIFTHAALNSETIVQLFGQLRKNIHSITSSTRQLYAIESKPSADLIMGLTFRTVQN